MGWESMALNLPPNATPAREQAILDLIDQGAHSIAWSVITSDHDGHHAEFWVFSDALKIDDVRVNVTAATEQKIADKLDCMLLTPKLADMIWAQRDVTLPPFPRGNTNGMASTQAMIDHSAKIDAALAKLSEPYGLICTVGKHWVLDNALATKAVGTAMNYGWHFKGPSFQGSAFETTATMMKDENGQYVRLIQGRGTRHDMRHVDYSQICVLVSQECTVDGNTMRLSDVLSDPTLAPLANHGGVLKVLRQPGVPAP